MRRHATVEYVLPPVIELPTGNVHLLPPVKPPPHRGVGGWVIHDGDGTPLKPSYDTRADALREMTVLGLRSGVFLPLTLYSPEGEATGDRLA